MAGISSHNVDMNYSLVSVSNCVKNFLGGICSFITLKFGSDKFHQL